MDGREGMALSGPAASYYLHRGGLSAAGPVPGMGSGSGLGSQPGAPAQPHGFKPLANPNVAMQSANVGGGAMNPSQSFSRSAIAAVASPVTPGDPVKKKRGRPRKYGPDGANMSLALSPLSPTPSSGALTSSESKRARGRPRGSGWKQQLAPLGEWMNSSAGLAFTPHVIHAGVGEDVAMKVLSFAQQRPRALCVLSANGSVSAVTLRQPVAAGGTVTYEGRFQILCLSGSYLVAETGGPRNRTGGLSISVCSPDGHVVGGAIGGKLIAASSVQVVVCSFVYGGKTKSKPEGSIKSENNSAEPAENSLTPISAPNKSQTPNAVTVAWSPGSRPDPGNSQLEIDLTRG